MINLKKECDFGWVFLPGESHGGRSLVGYSPWVAKSQTWLSNFTFTFFHFYSAKAISKSLQMTAPAAESIMLQWRRTCTLRNVPYTDTASTLWESPVSLTLMSLSSLLFERWITMSCLVAQMIKNLPAIQETRSIPASKRSSGEGNGYPLRYSCLENSMDRRAWQATYSPWGHKESDTTEQLCTHTCIYR